MNDFLNSPFVMIGSFLISFAILVGAMVLAGHISSQDTLTCIEVVKDKSAIDILALCKGIR